MADSKRRSTERLVLRPPQAEDLGFLTMLFALPEIIAHRPVPKPDTPSESAARLASELAHWQEHGFGRWMVQLDGKLIGFGGLSWMPAYDALNISYHLLPAVWGRGLASELVREATRFAFTELKADRVMGLVRPGHPASRRVLEKCGFVYDAPLALRGAPIDRFWALAPKLPSQPATCRSHQ
ncbi:MAG: GNAT family N-acetyltransferase [Rhizomicrobium sp.]|nr:GNAT family N-acetyltransferase [Rhizomicrobium sp.]